MSERKREREQDERKKEEGDVRGEDEALTGEVGELEKQGLVVISERASCGRTASAEERTLPCGQTDGHPRRMQEPHGTLFPRQRVESQYQVGARVGGEERKMPHLLVALRERKKRDGGRTSGLSTLMLLELHHTFIFNRLHMPQNQLRHASAYTNERSLRDRQKCTCIPRNS